MMDAHRGHCPEVEHLIGAWAATSLYWSDQCRVLEATPATIFADVGKWHHKWTWVPSPEAMERYTPGRPSAHSTENDSVARELQNRLDAATGQVKRLQAAQDKQEYQNRRSVVYDNRTRGPDGREAKAKGAKGGQNSKAKGKGGSFQQAQFGGKQGGGSGGNGGSARRKRARRGY